VDIFAFLSAVHVGERRVADLDADPHWMEELDPYPFPYSDCRS